MNRDDPRLFCWPNLNLTRARDYECWFALLRHDSDRWVNYPWYRLFDCEVLWSAI